MTSSLCPFAAGTHAVGRIHDRLRQDTGVHRDKLPDGSPVWIIGGYEAVTNLLADHRMSAAKSDSTTNFRGQNLPRALDMNLLNIDGEQHRRVRRLATTAFAPEHHAAHKRVVGDAAKRLIGDLPASGELDLMSGLCEPLPPRVIGTLLGLPQDKLDRFQTAARPMFAIDTSEEGYAIQGALGAMLMLVAGAINDKRQHPGDDMLSGWIAARDGEDCLSEEELISLAFATIIGGFENVTALTALVIDEAVRFRSTETRLAVDSADSGSLPKLVREIISDVAPVNYALRRFPLEDIAVNGITIPRGETVILSLRSANTDPARGARPDLAFGRGRHFCIGASLAETEAIEALRHVFRRWPRLRPTKERSDLVLRHSWLAYSLAELSVYAD
ncbi:hypothetical protein [Rhodococcus sp. IEGM 1307]|uniref:hypothetical protein n=1 Tax=Rhodococcus sp. IEGM 1307 TaxID=3047091 RepID=UPI0024B74699|nr:hypothetical protein [Rhodococcus sp. IEGM 1307]MDI9979762.1 hypothetical protein [Rhodococcus sp. IEGM 1307]